MKRAFDPVTVAVELAFGLLALSLLATSAACADPPAPSKEGVAAEVAPGSPAESPSPRRPRRDVASPEERAAWRATLRPVEGEAGPVRLLVPAGREGEPALRALAAELSRAVAEMAPRVAVARPGGGDPSEPVEIALESDLAEQAIHAGAIGPLVAPRLDDVQAPESPAVGPDLHLAPPAAGISFTDEAWAHRVALARHLLERSGAVEGAGPTLLDGAALWLAGGDWYGRPVAEWIPLLAAADLLPTADELLTRTLDRETGRDHSDVLWAPVAAAVIDALPGAGATERLAAADREAVAKVLRRLARRAAPTGEAPEPPTSAPVPAGFQRGVSLAMLNSLDGGYHAPSNREALERLAGIGSDAVSLMPFAFQREPREPALGFRHRSPRGETDAGLVHAARTARSLGFTVLWKPHIWVGHESWPGEIEMDGEADWRLWWRSYRRYVLHHAVLAAYAEADLLALGVELEKTVERREDWLRLARDARRFFPGALTYAANWGSGADRVAFWDAVDLAGVDAYYPLSSVTERPPSDRELAEGAEEVAARLEAVARRSGKPLLLTEVGFPARAAAWSDPHREGGHEDPEDEASQARAYRALLAALEDRPWLRGIYVWKAFSSDSSWRGDRPDFRFLGRPAAAEIEAFFRAVEDP